MSQNGRVLDDELREVASRILDKYPNKRSAALPLLYLVQSVEGHVTEDGMREVAGLLGLTPAEVLATSSFYTMLKKRPQGDYLISVCRNITCTHLGARKVFEALEERLGIETGQSTEDGKFMLESAECLATCDGAPSMQINYEDFYRVTPQNAVEIVDKLDRGHEVKSVRDQPVKTSKEIAYEMATTGLRRQTVKMEAARTIGGESPPPDVAPGFRPKESGDLVGSEEEGNREGGEDG
jgi:NADH-quinone oxidoreductase subunit E